jgi:signal transduction histidine kinase
MTHEVGIAGWVAAAVALAAAGALRRTLSARMHAVARACHELRGPLSAVRLGLELGTRPGELSPDKLRAIELELGCASRALDDLAQAPRGRCDDGCARELVNIEELLADSVEAWRAAADGRGVELRFRSNGRRAIVVGERLRLAQATGNLLANAIEHGAGTIEVRGRVEDGAVRIEVVDDGPGLSRPLSELMRSGWGLGGRASAHGHGLAIVSAIAEAHRGRLAAAPSERGARLVLELPLAEGLSLKEA